tara:strand:+ start:162 stop:425 length:264 start_codon:yes stop_codon:yes gene_type:complete
VLIEVDIEEASKVVEEGRGGYSRFEIVFFCTSVADTTSPFFLWRRLGGLGNVVVVVGREEILARIVDGFCYSPPCQVEYSPSAKFRS